MKRLLSLFDESGVMSQPFWDNGWDVIQWDIKLHEFMDINLLEDVETVLDMFEYVDGIIAQPPCTDFTVSGAQYWPKKDANGTTAKSLELVYQVMRLANLFTPTDPDYDDVFFWVCENPVGRLPKLLPELGKPLIVNPYEFAGYIPHTAQTLSRLNTIRAKNGCGVTDCEAEFVVKHNAYTKKTCLFGNFNRNLVRKEIEPVKCAPQGSFTQRYGGKSDKTKELRSKAPQGLALAFYEANKDYRGN